MRLALERRVRQVRSRALVRAWEYRQRNHARGAWFRLRRVLADAAEAYVVCGEDTQHLLEDGHQALAIGLEFSPPKTIVFAARERVAHGPGVRQVPVRLGAELLAAEHLVLVPFDGLPTDPYFRGMTYASTRRARGEHAGQPGRAPVDRAGQPEHPTDRGEHVERGQRASGGGALSGYQQPERIPPSTAAAAS